MCDHTGCPPSLRLLGQEGGVRLEVPPGGPDTLPPFLLYETCSPGFFCGWELGRYVSQPFSKLRSFSLD